MARKYLGHFLAQFPPNSPSIFTPIASSMAIWLKVTPRGLSIATAPILYAAAGYLHRYTMTSLLSHLYEPESGGHNSAAEPYQCRTACT
jgi:hypothetical protein